MTESDLVALVSHHEQQSLGYSGGELAEQRADAIDRYLGRPYGDEVEGQSSVVDTSIRDTVEWVMPQLLRIFISGDEVVRFEAESVEDEAAAKQETDYINWLALERNEAFNVFSSWFRDALMAKNGYVKVLWEKDESVELERYEGKTDDELALLMQDEDVEVVEHTSYVDPASVMAQMQPQIDPMTGQPVPAQPTLLHDVRLKRKRVDEYAKYGAVPPEELLIARTARQVSLADAEYVCHRRKLTFSDLRMMGYKIDDGDTEIGQDWDGVHLEDLARDRFNETDAAWDTTDPAMREVTYREIYIRCDYNGDGKAELRRVCMAGRKVLHNEETDLVPFATVTPIPFPHRHHGMSYHDIVRELEKIKTAIVRQFLDNLYLSNNVRTAADADNVSMDDLLTVKPGGVVRTIGSPGDKVMPLVVPSIGAQALQGIQYVDQWKENSTGINAYYQGLDPNALNKTATGISQLMSASMARTEAIARSFADGVKELFRLLHATTLKHARKAEVIKLSNNWVTVNPREWKTRKNLKVSVGLGTGSKEAQAQQMAALIQYQLQVLPLGIASPATVYNAMTRFANLVGYRNADEFFSDPTKQPPKPPAPPPEVQVEQMRIQAKQAEQQGTMQLEAAKAQQTVQLEQAKLSMQAELERFKAQLKAETDLAIARMKIEAEQQMAGERMRMDAALSDRQAQRDMMRSGRDQ